MARDVYTYPVRGVPSFVLLCATEEGGRLITWGRGCLKCDDVMCEDHFSYASLAICVPNLKMETLRPITRWADSKSKVFMKIELSDVKVSSSIF